MSKGNFLNIHVLISHSPSCLNRDDMNMQKSAIFGGARRVRISSQSLKRAMRKSEYFRINIGSPSIRTRQLGILKESFINSPELREKYPPELISEAIEKLSGNEVKEGEEVKDPKNVAVAPWAVEEVGRVCEMISELKNEGCDDKKVSKELGKRTGKDSALKKALLNAADIALFGRMTTSGVMSSIDGAVSVAHVITTHTVDADIDWFTAVDDLQEEGSGHLDTQEFSSGVFYRYASVNIGQLKRNIGAEQLSDTLALCAHFLHMMATVVPNAKQNSFAAFNPADYVMASFSDMPVSAANAFEEPVKNRKAGFMKPSVEAFEKYMTKVHAGYGLSDKSAVFSINGATIEPVISTLDGLKKWVRNYGE